MEDLTALRQELERLSAAVLVLSETQATHTELLRLVVEAATPEAGEDPLADMLARVIASLDGQAQSLARIEAALRSGPRNR